MEVGIFENLPSIPPPNIPKLLARLAVLTREIAPVKLAVLSRLMFLPTVISSLFEISRRKGGKDHPTTDWERRTLIPPVTFKKCDV